MANASVVTYAGRSIWLGRMKGVQSEPLDIGWGTSSVTGSANSDVALFTPATETRAAGTSSVTATNANVLANIYQVTGSLTCLVSGKTITEMGLYDTTTLSGTTTLATTLSAAATTSLTVGATIGPTTLNFYIQVENEVMLVTGGQNTTTMTVTRGALGSTSATHAVGVSVTVGGDGGAHTNFTLGGQTATVNAAAGGNMFCHADFGGIVLAVNDSILFTVQDTLT